PMTTPISTPKLEISAISATMLSMVARLMPNASSPIKASPESLSRMRLYFGAVIALHVSLACETGLRHHLGGKVGGLFLDALAHDIKREAGDSGTLRLQQRLDGLLVVLDKRLT